MANASMRNFSNKSNSHALNQSDVAPIMFDGKEVNTVQDLIAAFKLDTY